MGDFKLVCPKCKIEDKRGNITSWDIDQVKDLIFNHARMICPACHHKGLDFHGSVKGLKKDFVLKAEKYYSAYSIPDKFDKLPYNGTVVAVFSEYTDVTGNPDDYLLVIQKKSPEGYQSNVVVLKYNDYNVMEINIQQIILNLDELLELPMMTEVKMNFRLEPVKED